MPCRRTLLLSGPMPSSYEEAPCWSCFRYGGAGCLLMIVILPHIAKRSKCAVDAVGATSIASVITARRADKCPAQQGGDLAAVQARKCA